MTAGTPVSKPTMSSMPPGGRAQALRVSQGETVGGHAHNDCPGVADELIPRLPRLATGFVLLEVGNAMSRAALRSRFVEFYAWLRQHPRVRIVPVSEALFARGYELYAAREDKDWSLTDCISFNVMRDEELQAALTHDQHFEQAGYKALLR